MKFSSGIQNGVPNAGENLEFFPQFRCNLHFVAHPRTRKNSEKATKTHTPCERRTF